MSTSRTLRAAGLALVAGFAVAGPASLSQADEPASAPPAVEVFGTVAPGETLVEADWAAPVTDRWVEDERSQGAMVTEAPCVVGDRPTIEVPALRPYLRRPIRTTGHFVVTPSGNAHFVCHASVPSPARLPTQAVVVDGVPCFLPNRRRTNDSHVVLTPSGELTLTCHATTG